MNDLDMIDRTSGARPTDATAERLWSADQRAAALTVALDGSRTGAVAPRGTARRRVVLGTVAAGVVALALVGGSAVLPSNSPVGPAPQSAQAVALGRLAATAAAAPAIEPGQYWYTVQELAKPGLSWHDVKQSGLPDPATHPGVAARRSWAGPDGTVWEQETVNGAVESTVVAPSSNPTLKDPTPAFLETLPTDPKALRAYLDAHVDANFLDPKVSGVNTKGEAEFVAVGDMLRQGFASPALRSAALGVLTDLDGVQVVEHTTDPAGRPVTALTWTRPGMLPWVKGESTHSQQIFFIDPKTSRILSEATVFVSNSDATGLGGDGRTQYVVVTDQGTSVGSVPAAVLHAAKAS